MRKVATVLAILWILLLCTGMTTFAAGTDTLVDLNNDQQLNTDDAVYLLLHVLFGADTYPVSQKINLDIDASGTISTEDAVYLLLHVLFGEAQYPLYPGGSAKMELKRVGELSYYLYTPRNPAENMPLIVYLHGGTNKNADIEALLTTDGFPKYLYEGELGDVRAYVAIPKLESSYKGWADIYEQVRTLIKVLTDTYSIDSANISLTGHSMGGTGTYQLQTKLPNTFARIAPLSGSVKSTDQTLVALSKTKIWAFVGTADTVVDPESSRTIVSQLKAIGADAKLTELEGADHFQVPALVYKNTELLSWLIG